MKNNDSTFKIELQQVKNIKTVLIDNVYHIYATRIDDRPTCCHNHKMRVFDSCFDIKHNEKLKTASECRQRGRNFKNFCLFSCRKLVKFFEISVFL